MDNKLLDTLQKTWRWIFVAGILLAVLNLITCLFFFLLKDRLSILSSIFLLVFVCIGIITVIIVMRMKEHTQGQTESSLELLLRYELTLLNCLIIITLQLAIILPLFFWGII